MTYFWGEDTYGARAAIEDLARQGEATLSWVDRHDLATTPLMQWLAQANSLFGKRLVVLLDVSSWPKAIQEEVVKQESVFIWDRVTKKDSLVFKNFKKQATQFPGLDKPTLVRWLSEQAALQQGSIDTAAAGLLVDRLGMNRYLLENELQKLLLTTRNITAAQVREAISETALANIFSAIEAAAAGQEQKTLAALSTLLEAGENELYIITMLAYQFRLLFLIRAGIEEGADAASIAKRSGLKPYSIEKSWNLARRFTTNQLLDALTKILATDFSIKQGKLHARTGVIMLCQSLATSVY